MAANYPDVIPMIAYEDGPKAMDWLSSTFGFKEPMRMLDEHGRLSHGEMQAGQGVIVKSAAALGRLLNQMRLIAQATSRVKS